MQVEVNVKHMQTKIGGCPASSLSEIIATSKMAKFSFQTMVNKISINRNWLKKFMQVGLDVTCMYTNFGGHGPFGFRDTSTLKNSQIFLSDHGH